MADSTRARSGSPSRDTVVSGADAERRDASGEGAVGESAEQMLTEAKAIGSELAGAVRDSAVSLLDAQRSCAADQIAAIGEALKCSVQSLETASSATVIGYTDRAADRIADLAETVR